VTVLRHSIAERNLRPTFIDPYRPGLCKKRKTITAPAPLFWRFHQSALHRHPAVESSLQTFVIPVPSQSTRRNGHPECGGVGNKKAESRPLDRKTCDDGGRYGYRDPSTARVLASRRTHFAQDDKLAPLVKTRGFGMTPWSGFVRGFFSLHPLPDTPP
jgi:hypothetical protein